MTFNKHVAVTIGLCAAALLVFSCGDKKKEEKKQSQTTLERIAKEAMDRISPEGEILNVTQMVEAAGYVTKEYSQFPVQEIGMNGRMLVYTDKKGKSSGGLIFFKKTGFVVTPAWHWYFDNNVPESVKKIELNDDGLWDIRITMKDGDVLELLQDDSFDLTAFERSDWIALNGTSSEPVSADHKMWKCFDGDSSTTWSSSAGDGKETFLEVPAPFGIEEGILTLQTAQENQPLHCTLYADGKKVQEFELQPTAASQVVRLEEGVKGAKRVKLTFDSVHGGGDVVSVAEMGLK